MSETRRRNRHIMVRCDEAEALDIASRATAAGVSQPEFLRRAALSRRLDMQARITAESLRQLARIGSNLNQLTHLSHLGESNLKDVSSALAEVREAAAALVGKGGSE